MSRREACWHCGAETDPAALDREGFLLPRTAARGGPVLLWRCRACGVESVVERNRARETLLVPPPVAGVRSATVRGDAAYAARKWEAERRAERAAFHARTAAAPPAEVAGAGPGREVGTRPVPRADEPEDEPVSPREVSSVLAAYEVLGLPLTASAEEIHRRYRELSKKCHPDRVADLDESIRRTADRRFREISRAYEVLNRSPGAT